MLKQRSACLTAAARLVCCAPLSRSFAAPNPQVSTLTVPHSLNGLRADRVLLALLQVSRRVRLVAVRAHRLRLAEMPVVCDPAGAGR